MGTINGGQENWIKLIAGINPVRLKYIAGYCLDERRLMCIYNKRQHYSPG